MNPVLAASGFHGRVGSAGPDSSQAEACALAQSSVQSPGPLPPKARLARPSEPILFPKLRI